MNIIVRNEFLNINWNSCNYILKGSQDYSYIPTSTVVSCRSFVISLSFFLLMHLCGKIQVREIIKCFLSTSGLSVKEGIQFLGQDM